MCLKRSFVRLTDRESLGGLLVDPPTSVLGPGFTFVHCHTNVPIGGPGETLRRIDYLFYASVRCLLR